VALGVKIHIIHLLLAGYAVIILIPICKMFCIE